VRSFEWLIGSVFAFKSQNLRAEMQNFPQGLQRLRINNLPKILALEMLPKNAMSEPARVLGKRILLVDDDVAARESIKLLLSIDRHGVIEAKNGQEALQLFSQAPFDLVIIDYFMPQMKGKELAAYIKMAAPLLPILMVTAYLEKLVDTDTQVDAMLPKPFGIAELREAICKLVRRRSCI
jgi:CheY-like chemotaxis protein